MTTETFDLTTPGGTPVTLLLGANGSGFACVLQATAKGCTVLTAGLSGTRLMTTMGAIELGAAAEQVSARLARLDKGYEITHAVSRRIHEEARKSARETTRKRVAAELVQVRHDEDREKKEQNWKAKGWM